jgi:hypothetical protein
MAKVFKHLDWVIKGNWLNIFEFGDLGLKVDDLPILPYHDYPQLNQYKYAKTKSACTIVWALIDACYLYEIKPTDQDMLECVEFANKECGYQFWKWWFADLGMRAVEKRFEQKYWKKLYYSTMRWDNPDFWKLLKKWYMLWFTYDGNYAYNKDYQSDSILDGIKFWKREYWHRTSLIYKDKKIYVVDSSAGNKYNVYEVKDLIWLIQNWVYDETFFIYTKEVDLPKQTDTKELSRLVQMRNNCKTINYNCNKQITLTNDTLYQNDLREMINKNDSKIKDIDEMIKRWESWII